MIDLAQVHNQSPRQCGHLTNRVIPPHKAALWISSLTLRCSRGTLLLWRQTIRIFARYSPPNPPSRRRLPQHYGLPRHAVLYITTYTAHHPHSSHSAPGLVVQTSATASSHASGRSPRKCHLSDLLCRNSTSVSIPADTLGVPHVVKASRHRSLVVLQEVSRHGWVPNIRGQARVTHHGCEGPDDR